jgi:monoamine oxidase
MTFKDFHPPRPSRASWFSVLKRTMIRAIAVCATSVLLWGQNTGGPPPVPRPLGGAECSDSSTVYDVVVIGAGLAGLTAAKELRRLGHTVLVLEANDRIGGRAYTADISGVPIDYGGAWLHGVPTNPLAPLADALGFTRKRTEFNLPFYIDERISNETERRHFEEASEEYEAALENAAAAQEYQRSTARMFCSAAEKIGESKAAARPELAGDLCRQLHRSVPDQALAQRLCASARLVKNSSMAAKACRAETRRIHVTPDAGDTYLPTRSEFSAVLPLLAANAGPLESATELHKASAYDASQFEASDDDLVVQGFGRFVEKIGEGLPVCLNSRVSDVQYGPTVGTEIRAGGRVYRAKYALVTVSVGVLRAKRIAFHPPLPKWKQTAIDHLQMGNLQKVIIPFSRDIFPNVPDSSWIVYEGNIFPFDPAKGEASASSSIPRKRGVMAFVIKPLGKNMAIGFFGGDQAKAFEERCATEASGSGPRGSCDDPAIKTARRALVNMFKDPVDEAIQSNQIHVTRWSLDETSLGAYSVPEPGYWDMRETLRKPVGEPGADEDAEGPKQLYFAGEATSRAIYNGSFPGAYETGMQAAREIHTAILESRARPLHHPSKK